MYPTFWFIRYRPKYSPPAGRFTFTTSETSPAASATVAHNDTSRAGIAATRRFIFISGRTPSRAIQSRRGMCALQLLLQDDEVVADLVEIAEPRLLFVLHRLVEAARRAVRLG